MKILVNVARDCLKVGEWVQCQGLKLEELADGSFDLIVTTDLERMRESDREVAELVERMQKGTAS